MIIKGIILNRSSFGLVNPPDRRSKPPPSDKTSTRNLFRNTALEFSNGFIKEEAGPLQNPGKDSGKRIFRLHLFGMNLFGRISTVAGTRVIHKTEKAHFCSLMVRGLTCIQFKTGKTSLEWSETDTAILNRAHRFACKRGTLGETNTVKGNVTPLHLSYKVESNVLLKKWSSCRNGSAKV